MITKIQKWGNSQGVRLSKELLAEVRLEVGDPVHISVREGSLVLAPVRHVRGTRSLEELVAHVPKDYQPGELDWGPGVGQEVW